MAGVPAGYINIKDAAIVAGRNPRWLKQIASEGKIPGAFKMGTAKSSPWCFTVEGLEQWMHGEQDVA